MFLNLEAHLVVGAPRHQVKLVSDPPDEIQGIPEFAHFGLGQQSEMQQVVQVAERGLGAASHPISRVVIPERARSLLDVRLQQKEGFAVLTMPPFEQFGLLAHKGAHILKQLATNGIGKIVKKFAIPAEEARGEHGSPHGDIGAPHGQGILDGSSRAAHGQAGIPKPVLEALGDTCHVGTQLVPVDDQEIDVRVNRHFPAGEAPYRHHRDTRLQFPALGEDEFLCYREESADQAIRHVGVRFIDEAPRARLPMQALQVAPAGLEVGTNRRGNRALQGQIRRFQILESKLDLRGRHQSPPSPESASLRAARFGARLR